MRRRHIETQDRCPPGPAPVSGALSRALHRVSRYLPTLLAPLIVLALTLGAVSHGYAQARSGPAPTTLISVVICADGAMQTILLDETGAPVAPQHCLAELCDACLTPVSDADLGAIAGVAFLRAIRADTPRALPVAAMVQRSALAPRPRGPPDPTRLS